jgi:hypothetical protein
MIDYERRFKAAIDVIDEMCNGCYADSFYCPIHACGRTCEMDGDERRRMIKEIVLNKARKEKECLNEQV